MTESAPESLDPVIARLVAAFERKMNEERSTQVVITLHQFVAVHLSRLIEHSFVHDGDRCPESLEFSAKLSLAVALGHLEPEEAAPLAILDGFYGRFLRDLDAALTEADPQAFESAIASSPMAALFAALQSKHEWGALDYEHRLGWGGLTIVAYLSQKLGAHSELVSQMEDVQGHNLHDFKRVAGTAWHTAGEVAGLPDVILRSLTRSQRKLSFKQVAAVSTLLHSARRAGAAGLLSFARHHILEGQPQFRRFLEGFGFAWLCWKDEANAQQWLSALESPQAYEQYRKDFGKQFKPALRELDEELLPSIWEAFSRGTHSSLASLQQAMRISSDDTYFHLGLEYFDAAGSADTKEMVARFCDMARIMFRCQEAFALHAFKEEALQPAMQAWVAARTPVFQRWLVAEGDLRRRVGLPVDPGQGPDAPKPRAGEDGPTPDTRSASER